jgi:predicted lipoprotein
MSSGKRRSPTVARLVAGGAVVVLVIAMALSTKFLTPEEVSALNPEAFNAETFVEEEFPGLKEEITRSATDIAVLAPAVAKDPAAAGAQYGQDLGSGAFAFPVTATGEATQVDAEFILLSVPGLPAQVEVRIPLGAAVSGTPVRDATGTLKFGDFVDQTAFQSVANELKLKIERDVLSTIDPQAVKGTQITVVGAWATGGPPNSFIIQPVSIEVAS